MSRDSVAVLLRELIAQDTAAADECEEMAARLGEKHDTHNELRRDAAQYRLSAYRFGLVATAFTREAAPQASGGDELPCTDSDNCRRCSEDADTPHSGIPRGTLATTDSAHPQASVYVACRQCDNCGHAGINDESPTDAACHECDWHGPSPAEDHCPGCNRTSCMGAACPRCQSIYRLVADTDILATTDSAIQSQQGATGGAVDDAAVERALDFYYDNSPFNGPDELKAAIRGCIEAALAHPQAAGSAPGEAMQEAWLLVTHPTLTDRCDGGLPRVVRPSHLTSYMNAGWKTTTPPSAGSVASGAGEFHIEHIDADHVRLTPIATAAGSAPVGVEGLWTDKQCVEFLSVAFRHCYIDGTFKLDDIRMGQRRANKLAATPAVSVGDA